MLKQNKKVFALIIVLVFALIMLAGCGGGKNRGGDDDDGGEINISIGGGNDDNDDDDYDIGGGNGDDDYDIGGDDGDNDWDIDLDADWPKVLPKYTDGKVESISTIGGGAKTGGDSTYITITNTSKAALGKYVDVVKKDGWEVQGEMDDGAVVALKKGDLNLMLNLEDDGTTVGISILVM